MTSELERQRLGRTPIEAVEAANQLRDAGHLEAAISAYVKILDSDPDSARTHCELGIAYLRSNRPTEAESCFRQAVQAHMTYPEACNHLGILLAQRGEREEAEIAYRNILTEDVDYFDAHINLGTLLRGSWRRAEALYHFQRALLLDPNSSLAKQELGHLLYDLGRATEAMGMLQQVVAQNPESAAAWINLGRCHMVFQELDQMETCCRKAIPLEPRQLAPWNNLLLAQNWRSVDREQAYLLHLEFGKHLLNDWGISPRQSFDNPIDRSRRLRIGFVSGDFRQHSVSYFIESALKHFDTTEFETWAYYNHSVIDSRTEALKAMFSEWRDVHGLSAAHAANLIQGDGIDILIDLSGHTGHNRLNIFAHKPAPIQASWIGYPNTTGLQTIDYRITDAEADPPGLTERFHSETLIRLPHCFLCYTPPRTAPAITESPVSQNGFITFGSFNARVKISDETLGLWSRILDAVGGSRLIIKSVTGIADEGGSAKLIEQIRRANIDPARVSLLAPKSSVEEHLASYGEVDIALDTFPYNGTTTTCEALWMGVPVVTLAGDRHAARVGASLLRNCGLEYLVAETMDEYVRIAVDLARAPNKLAEERSSIRQRLLGSPLLDAAASTRHLEQALRTMWLAYCDGRESTGQQQAKPVATGLMLEANGGYKISVAEDPLQNMTTWVMLEQEDWFEDDIRFVRRIARPTWNAFDIGANHGVYALSLAASGVKTIWAFEPVSGPRMRLRSSIGINRFQSRVNVVPIALSSSASAVDIPLSLHTELNSLMSRADAASGHEKVTVDLLDAVIDRLGIRDTSIDFVKLDAEGAEPAIVRGGLRFFTGHSPLVMFERPDDVFDSDLVELFHALNYEIFRLVSGLSCLVPISRDKAEALDPFDLNLYACKVDRAAQLQAQGMLARETLHDDLPLSSTWSGALFSLPALAALAPATWRDYDYSIAYGKAVLAWCGSRRSDLEPEARVRLLAQGLSHLQSAIEEDDNHPAVAVLGIRMCADAGMRSQALAIAASFLEQMSADEAFPLDRPVPPAYEAFDQIRPTRSMGSFLHQSVVEFNLDRSRHSTVFGGGRTTAFEEGLANPEHTARFERTAVLCKARDGTPLRVETSARLFFEAPDNRNFGFWRKAAEAGKLFSTSGNPTWDCQIHSPIPARMQPAGEDEALSRIAAHEARGDAHSTLAEAEKGLLAFPKSANLMNIAAAAAHSLKDSAKAERLWRAAISADPAYADPYSNLGFLLTEARRFEEAEVLLRRALEVNPRHGGALCNLGILFIETGRPGDAERAFTNVLSILPTHSEALNNLGLLLKARGDVGGAEQAYLRALAASPQHARAFNNLGVLLFEAKQNSRAETMLRRALQLMPDYPDAHNNLGLVLMQARRIEEAESEFRRAIELKSDDPGVQMNLGVLMKEMRRFPEAEAAFRRALEISPDCGNAAGEAYFCSRYLCDWSRCADDEARLADMIDRGIGDISPFILLAIDNAQLGDIPQLQRRGAALYARDFCRAEMRGSRLADHLPTGRNRLRIGYLSADFHQHPTMYLLRGVLAAHDRSRYSVHLYSYGSVDDEMTARARAACEVFRDISQLSDDEAANAISADKIDILIDLKGFTFDARPEISARRPAPIIASWLGYPGTLGQSQLADYVIGDPIVTPPENAEHFVERIARLPYCYQPNDRERSIGLTPDRSQVGLPEHAFVFCCFNSSYKLTPDMFYLWCRLLHEVPGSVLWLLEPCSQAITNLRCSALQRGVDPERIVFAPVQPLAEHLARLQLADLALDTFPYTSHTTGSDVLWAGVPLVTRIGQTFASRVAASLLQSIGLPELVTHSPNDYVALALSLAKNPERLAEIRLKLERNRLTTPLFDTESFTVELEQLYARIWEEHGKE